ncbi:MAG: transcription termination factor NusA [Planctomycetota bacterium]|nr:transcription termination factor NusA [Planctomycetota bacterium]
MANNADILRYIDSIARDKEIDKESLVAGIEQAMTQALAKKYGVEDVTVNLDRQTGELECNYDVSMEEQGRIFAMSVKQAIIGRVREAERDVIYDEFEQKLGDIVSGTVQRFEGDTVIVNLGRNLEGILPRAEKVRSESYNIGERIRAMILEVKKIGSRVKVILSRAHRDLVRALFELEVPEIADGTIQIRRIEREPGFRTKLAVDSNDTKVDCIGACVGVRGNRIKLIIDELNGERIDIIRWNDDPTALIPAAMKPAEIAHVELDPATRKALVLVSEDQQSLAIGRKGQNVRLASKLTGWDIDIMTRAELERSVEAEDQAIAGEEGTEAGEASTEAGEASAEAGETSTEAGGTSAEAGGTSAEAGGTSAEAGETSTEASETPADAEASPDAAETAAAADAPAEADTTTEQPVTEAPAADSPGDADASQNTDEQDKQLTEDGSQGPGTGASS